MYPDNYANPLDTYLQLTEQVDSEGNLQTSNPETSGRYHSTWLSMMYPRLFLARQLLTEDGIIFVSIDDHEVYNLHLVMNEIFGEENCLQQLIWQRHAGGANDAKHFATDHEYILTYARNLQTIDRLRRPLTEKEKQVTNWKTSILKREALIKPVFS
ncbi:MAG: site-specific DNA-methyltransferase [Gammaproteobacteria bacterium]|nr:site-specific DNA-methyltransferase [Gammaproteobacteria bacterium]